MKTVTVTKKQEVSMGTHYAPTPSWKIFHDTVKVSTSEGKVLAVFVKRVIRDPRLLKSGRDLKIFKMLTNNRPIASGYLIHKTMNSSNPKIIRGKPVSSAMVGFAGPSTFHPCRATTMFRKNLDAFNTMYIHVVRKVSDLFRQYCPSHWKAQKAFVDACNQAMVLPKTVFTTLTVNVDFPTAAHTDGRDFDSGLGNLAVFNAGRFSGGELLLPEYKIGFAIKEGDILFFDVHTPHCNAPMTGTGRVSLICYAHKRILNLCKTATKSKLFGYTGALAAPKWRARQAAATKA